MKKEYVRNIGIVLLVLTFRAFANQESPDWIKNFKSEDAVYKYYLGVSDFVESQSQAVKEATQNARGQAIEENFGVDALYQANLIQTEDNQSSQSEMQTRSKNVRLFGFERVQQDKVGTQMFLLYRYPKSEIQKEKDRLSMVSDKAGDQVAETDSESANKYPTTVNIQTDPPGAHIFIDGKSWGLSPLTLKGHLAQGSYDIFIQKEKFQDLTKKIVVIKGQNKVFAKLFRSTATLKVELENFTGASVYLNGTFLGKTPLERKIILLAENYSLKISHPHILPIHKELEFDSEEVKIIKETADIKKVLVRMLVFPKTAVIRLNDQDYSPKNNSLEMKLIPGEYTMQISADSYESSFFQFTVVPGKENFIGTIKLDKSKIPKIEANVEPKSYPRRTYIEPSPGSQFLENIKSLETFYQMEFDLISSQGANYPINNGSLAIGNSLGATFFKRKLDFYLGVNVEKFTDVGVNSYQQIRVFGFNTYAGGLIHYSDDIGFGYETGQGDFTSERASEVGIESVPKYKITRGYAKAFVSFKFGGYNTPMSFNIGVKNCSDQVNYFSSDKLKQATRKTLETGSSLFIQFTIRKY